mmetsp:Transcript_7893/g.23496  ORF Transcript_7893/g.23496 Transcript_7893/m.23496 type:complete len:535 (-) Transcript_7893:39-1643(-)|eukprot:CAMPEP_0119272876 /NCGR_PEP_ID=MMETSP1329-20130426/9123_1 /TAXON_ID=114041 /ORGANISM="Genus nov. species nov., Strain RCC1024" /LENGTH=534 /DNA_ID=CAMNT_0007272987 /DNA_START=155 /DNA_END=1759 /DNA_ORIENTATION=-
MSSLLRSIAIALVAASASALAPVQTLRATPATQKAAAVMDAPTAVPDAVSADNPLRVVIAGAGVGGLTLANALGDCAHVDVTLVEKTSAFKRFGGPIQLASNAMQLFRELDRGLYDEIESKFTWTGNLTNGIKDGIRDEWYAKFDLASPARNRNMPYTGVIERPDLQEILLGGLKEGVVRNGNGVGGYERSGSGVTVALEDGSQIEADVLVGADGIWSNVRAAMRDEPARGDGSGVSYSGYTVFAGELEYASPDNGEVGYKVYIGPNQYFVITDIGKGRYQYYAFLARPPGSAEDEEKPDGTIPFLKQTFEGWSPDVHAILDATREDEIEQRDLYDRPPSAVKPWSEGPVALLGDSVHAMMPNLGQGGCQAIEDALVLDQEIRGITSRKAAPAALETYRNRRLVRSASVQGLSRFASDIIIRGFDTPAKIVDGRFENFNYAGIVTRMLQPILPLFFAVQFNFLYEGWRNEAALDLKAGLAIGGLGLLILALGAGAVGDAAVLLPLGLENLLGAELFTGISETLSSILPSVDGML